MKERRDLFSFNFEKTTQKSHILEFLKENKIDFFENLQEIYADIFGEDIYYRLVVEHVCKELFEVYYEPETTVKRGLDRSYFIKDFENE